VQVKDLIGGTVVSCEPGASLAMAAREMRKGEVGCVTVMKAGTLIGVVTERDIIHAMAEGAPATAKVADWMTPEPDTVDGDVDIEEAAEWMLATGYRHLPVIDGAALVGVLSIKDVLWAMAEPRKLR
jgi:CBS domain-containing protein